MREAVIGAAPVGFSFVKCFCLPTVFLTLHRFIDQFGDYIAGGLLLSSRCRLFVGILQCLETLTLATTELTECEYLLRRINLLRAVLYV